jgi:hypothetical protein
MRSSSESPPRSRRALPEEANAGGRKAAARALRDAEVACYR